MKTSDPEAESMIELTCRSCVHFVDDPALIEREFPYIATFGSAYSSARGDAGICQKLDRFLDPLPAEYCASFLRSRTIKGSDKTGRSNRLRLFVRKAADHERERPR